MSSVVYSIVRVVFDNPAHFLHLTGHSKVVATHDHPKLRVKLVRVNQTYDPAIFAAEGIGNTKENRIPWILLQNDRKESRTAFVRSHEGRTAVQAALKEKRSIEVDILYKKDDIHTIKDVFETEVNFRSDDHDSKYVVKVRPQSTSHDDSKLKFSTASHFHPNLIDLYIDATPDMSGVYVDVMHQPLSGGVTRELLRNKEGQYILKEHYSSDEPMFSPLDTKKPGWNALFDFGPDGKGIPEFDKDGHSSTKTDEFLIKAVFEQNLKMIQWMTPQLKKDRHMENVWLDKTLFYPSKSYQSNVSPIADVLRTIAFSSSFPLATIHE